jgi:hypothetical protein
MRDPARFAFAHGGKDGTPFPVDRATYDRTIEVLGLAINKSKIDRSEKVQAFKRLAELGRVEEQHEGALSRSRSATISTAASSCNETRDTGPTAT